MKIGFIGLGKLGKDCAEVMAEHYDVTGFDIIPIETNRVNFTNNIEDTVMNKDFTFIAVPTPHHRDYGGEQPTSDLLPMDFDYSYVIETLEVLSRIDHTSTLVLISTVLPGTIRREFKKYLKTELIYNPYLIAMGTVKTDMKHPEMIIIGTENGAPTNNVLKLVNLYNEICPSQQRYEMGTWEEAESIKIFYNTFISMKIALTNMVMDVAEKDGHINCDKVMKALYKSKKRLISPMYMKPGMGDGGPCHPRDNIAMSSLAERLDLSYDLFNEIMFTREQQAHNLAMKLTSYRNPIVILGKSYKPNVDLTDGSYSMLVGYFCELEGAEVFYDADPEIYDEEYTYLLAHSGKYHNYNFKRGSVIVDPWGKCPNIEGCKVVWYGR